MKSRRRQTPGKALPRLRFSKSKRIDPKQVKALFRAGGWKEDLARYSPAQIQKFMRKSHLVLSAWDQKQLVGFTTAVSDGVLCGLVENLIIHPDYRGRGLGTRMLRELAATMKRQRITCLYALGNRGPRPQKFFRRVGFHPLDWKIYLRFTR